MNYKVDRAFLTERVQLKPLVYQKLLTIIFKAFTLISKKTVLKRQEVEEEEQESEEDEEQIEEEEIEE